jgi:hypothetical protein
VGDRLARRYPWSVERGAARRTATDEGGHEEEHEGGADIRAKAMGVRDVEIDDGMKG